VRDFVESVERILKHFGGTPYYGGLALQVRAPLKSIKETELLKFKVTIITIALPGCRNLSFLSILYGSSKQHPRSRCEYLGETV